MLSRVTQIVTAAHRDLLNTPTDRFAFGLTYFSRSRVKMQKPVFGSTSVTNRNRCTQRLVILHAQTWWITDHKTGHPRLLYWSKTRAWIDIVDSSELGLTAQRTFVSPPDIVVGVLRFYRDSIFFFIRQLPFKLAERNSAKTDHTLGSERCQKSGVYPVPVKIGVPKNHNSCNNLETHYLLTLALAVPYQPSKTRPTCSDGLNLKPPAPLHPRTYGTIQMYYYIIIFDNFTTRCQI